MASIVKILRAAAEPNRLRILLLLKEEELSVAELQEILVMGQSSISTHLSQLKQAGLVEDRRTGKSSLYRLATLDSAAERLFTAGDLRDVQQAALTVSHAMRSESIDWYTVVHSQDVELPS